MAAKKIIPFTKMQGAGNDFIVIEARKDLNYRNLARRVCQRTFGIGADGLLVLDTSKKADYRMHIINADGSVAQMCGNGIRCLAAYIVRHRKPQVLPFFIETLAGIIVAKARDETALVKLSQPYDYQPDIPLNVLGKKIHVNYINTGVPHTVIYVDALSNIDVAAIGRAVRYHKRFAPAGTNVNFVEQIARDRIAVRTYERGVEDETKACGTGSVAAAVISFLKTHPEVQNRSNIRMTVLTQSKEMLENSFNLKNGKADNVWLKGPAKFIAQGTYYF